MDVAPHMDERTIPLVVDVDGTLLKTDLLAESFRALLLSKPLQALRALGSIRSRAAFKRRVAQAVTLDLETLPMHQDVLALMKQAKAQGRPVYLASGADAIYVEALAARLGFLDGVFASDGITNLTRTHKARLLCTKFGAKGFDYIGNEHADFKVWNEARKVLVVATAGRIAEKAKSRYRDVELVGKPTQARTYIRAMRVHQWAKNLLIFVPMVMAHAVAPSQLLLGVMAFFSFSCCASAVYLLNDWADIDHDRKHPTKRDRTFASGALSLAQGAKLVMLLLMISLLLGLWLPPAFLPALGVYFLLTLSYSLWLKHHAIIDVMTLACLYGIRLLCGAALGVALSDWLVAFSVFLFLSLAMIKRCAELHNCIAQGRSKPMGRGYQLSDVNVMFAMATASGYVAVLVLAFYLQSPDVSMLYSYPKQLWGACLILAYWISRVLLLTARGQMNEDPVTFAVTDRASLACAVLLGLLLSLSL